MNATHSVLPGQGDANTHVFITSTECPLGLCTQIQHSSQWQVCKGQGQKHCGSSGAGGHSYLAEVAEARGRGGVRVGPWGTGV